MINYIILGFIILAAIYSVYRYVKKIRSGGCGREVDTPKNINPPDKNLKNFTIHKTGQIEDMTCNNCASNIENA